MKLGTIIIILFALLPPLISAIVNQIAKAKAARLQAEQRRARLQGTGVAMEPTSVTRGPVVPSSDVLAEQRRLQIERLRQRRGESTGPARKQARGEAQQMPVLRRETGSGRMQGQPSPVQTQRPPARRQPAPVPVPEEEPVRRTVPSRTESPKPTRREQKRARAGPQPSTGRQSLIDSRPRQEGVRRDAERLSADATARMHEHGPQQSKMPSDPAQSRLTRQLFSSGQRLNLRQLIIAKELLDAPLSLRAPGM